jgi:hypothetical protein
LAIQHAEAAELVVDLPNWVHPVGLLNGPFMAGLLLSLIPLAAWYLLRWVLGPFFKAPPLAPSP